MRTALSLIILTIIAIATTGCLHVNVLVQKKLDDGTVVVYSATGMVGSLEQKDLDLIKALAKDTDEDRKLAHLLGNCFDDADCGKDEACGCLQGESCPEGGNCVQVAR